MLKELISKLKFKKKQLEKYEEINNQEIVKEDIEEDKVEIIVSKVGDFSKIEISDYITIGDYVKKMRSSEEYNILNSICNCVLWNGNKQKVNKGTYYVLFKDNCIYNFLFNDEKIEIDERMKIAKDKDKENITQERVITLYLNQDDYHYFSAKHEANGNTYYTKYYNKIRRFSMGTLDLTEEETYDEISEVVNNLENITEIENMVDLDLIKESILKDLKEKSIVKKKVL